MNGTINIDFISTLELIQTHHIYPKMGAFFRIFYYLNYYFIFTNIFILKKKIQGIVHT